jgi:hypothetical protein
MDIVRVYDGEPLTHETLLPGNTPTGISASVYAIDKYYYVTSGADVVSNGNMETTDPPAGWTASGTATLAQDTSNRTNSAGTKAIKITAGAATDYCYQDVTTVTGTRYRLRFYYKNTAGDLAQVRVTTDPSGTEADETLYDIYGNMMSTLGVVSLSSSTSYSSAQGLFFTATGTTTRIYLRAKTNTDIVYFDDVSLMPVSSWAGTRDGYVGKRLGNHAVGAMVYAESYATRFTLNGETPTDSTDPEPNIGIQLQAGYSYTISGINAVKGFRCVDDVYGSACKVRVVCYF